MKLVPKSRWSAPKLGEFAGGILAVAFILLGCTRAAAKPAALPNLVIIFTDDQGYADVGVFGAKGFQTPNLDKLASQGCLFRNFHVPQPVCSASRAGLLTGCYPNRIGIPAGNGRREPGRITTQSSP